jgi:RNA polymerase sigma-70 factor (ECF subfamily)
MMHSMAFPNESAGTFLQAGATDRSELETLFIGLVRDYHRILFNYVFRLVGDDALAEDVTQESYLRAYRGLAKLPPGSNHRAWLFRIATNAATDELRRRKRRPLLPLLGSLGLRAPGESEDERLGRVTLDEALMRLPERHRAILNLFEFAEFSAPEVGEVLGISPETARKRRQRAREALAAVLKGKR